MPRMTNAQLQARLEAVEAELAETAARAEAAEAAEAAGAASGSGAAAPPPPRRERRSAWWAALSVVTIVLASLLAPAALVATWAGSLLTDTDRFVATYAPVIQDPTVQTFVADRTTQAITDAVDIDGVVDAAFTGIGDAVGLPPAASTALGLLQGTVVEAVQGLIAQTVTSVVSSDAFAAVWAQSLRTAHGQFVATMQGDPTALVQLGDDGVLGVQLGPIVAEVKSTLQAQGVGLADLIPSIDATIVLVQSDALPAARLAYASAVAVAVALPILVLVLFAVGVLAARRRSAGLLGAGVGLGIAMGAVIGGFAAASAAIGLVVPVSLVPEQVSRLLFWVIAGDVRDVAVAVLVLAVSVVVIAWVGGGSRSAARLRGAGAGAIDAARRAAANRGFDTGRLGAVLDAQRGLVRAAIAVGAALVLLFVRPITVGLVIGTLVVALLVLLVAELLRPPRVVSTP